MCRAEGGTELWNRTYNPKIQAAQGYEDGWVFAGETGRAAWIARVDAQGAPRREVRHEGGDGDRSVEFRDVTVREDGVILAVGTVQSAGSEALVCAYDASGARLWEHRFGSQSPTETP